MIRAVILSFFFFFLGSSLGLVAKEEKRISKKEVYSSIEEMLSYHVEYKTFSPLLVKRSFRLFVEQFDPHKMYLLQQEVTPFWNMSADDLAQVVLSHSKKEYPLYERLNAVIRASILRARDFRQKIREKILSTSILPGLSEEGSSSFSATEDGLQARIQKQMIYALYFEKQQENLENLSLEDKRDILDLFERRLRRSEESYLTLSEERGFSMHLLKAFAKSLDAHSSFFSSEEAYELRTSLEKQFEGIGIVLREGFRGVVIKDVVAGGPADKSKKITPGDLLVGIEGEAVSSLSYQEVMRRLKGERGASILLTIQKKNGDLVSLTLVRDKIVMEAELVRHEAIPCGGGIIGVVELSSFYENAQGRSSEKDLKEALRKLRQQGDLKGLVLDMRNNSGGFLSQAVKVAGLFVSSGVIVISKYSQGQMQYLRHVDGKSFYRGPLVVLTSKASASATEIVAQALQDYGIAVVVGDERTYGKGTIQYQTVTDEKAANFFKVTVGKYYTVSGRSTQIEGVKADVVVPTQYAPFHVGEKYLPYALKNDQVPSAFLDPLIDVDGKTKAWLQKNYMPNLQKKLSFWTEILPLLRMNSKYRLEHDKNFLCFLEFLGKDPMPLESRQDRNLNFGVEDLQLLEAINVAKDMSLLQKYEKNRVAMQK